LHDAINSEDLPWHRWRVVDVIWGCLALGLRLGLPMAEMWEAIAKANMEKEAIHKPDGGVSADHEAARMATARPEGDRGPSREPLSTMSNVRPRHLLTFKVEGRAVPWKVGMRRKDKRLRQWQSLVRDTASVAWGVGRLPHVGPVALSMWFYCILRPVERHGLPMPRI
jgi:hypothetical protein